jgi:hypothetical protein
MMHELKKKYYERTRTVYECGTRGRLIVLQYTWYTAIALKKVIIILKTLSQILSVVLW